MAEGERKQEQSRKADRQRVSWLYVLEVDGRVETEAGQRSQGQDMREGQKDLMQEKGSSDAMGGERAIALPLLYCPVLILSVPNLLFATFLP